MTVVHHPVSKQRDCTICGAIFHGNTDLCWSCLPLRECLAELIGVARAFSGWKTEHSHGAESILTRQLDVIIPRLRREFPR